MGKPIAPILVMLLAWSCLPAGAQADGLPSGVIVMWSGELDAIPSGWALCDGSNGTPDLRDRFVLGVGAPEYLGSTGGSRRHRHPEAEGLDPGDAEGLLPARGENQRASAPIEGGHPFPPHPAQDLEGRA